MTIDDEALYIKYNIDIELYRGKPIDFDALRIRTVNCLRREGILEIDRLLSCTYDKLSKIKNLGTLSLNDIDEYITKLDENNGNNTLEDESYISARIKKYRDVIFEGDFSEISYDEINDQEIETINKCKKGYELIDKELILACRDNTAYVESLSMLLFRYSKHIKELKEFEELYELVSSKASNHIKPYYELYPYKNELSDEFRCYCEGEDTFVADLFNRSILTNSSVKEKKKFINWLSYDLKEELYTFLNIYYSRSANMERVITLRARKHTLQEIGDEIGITRERVRQIERKVVEPFCRWQRNNKFLSRLSADFDGESILGSTDLQGCFGEQTEILLYLLQCADDEFFSYDRETDTVIIVDDDITDFARDYVEKMPNEFDMDVVAKYREKAVVEYGIPEDVFEHEIASQYKMSGAFYHRNKLSREKMYQIILKRYYPKGMNIYDDEELKRFRKLLINEFGEVTLPEKNRAISAAIGRSCVLCDRGKYRVKDDINIPHTLLKKIHDYIMKSERSLFFMNEIYLEFEDELQSFGIDNRFFLQGILREEYEKDLFFRRDYVSKDGENLSLYRELQLFIKKSEYPVTKEQIREVYPGITEIMILVALSDDNIINYRGSYIHGSNLNMYDYDKTYIDKVMKAVVNDNVPHHCNDIYEVIQNANLDMLNRLGVFNQFSLFSLLQYLFKDQYVFVRPFIAQIGVEINKPKEVLHEFVLDNELFEISELLQIAKEYHYTIYDILKFLNSWNETHLLINKNEMASLEYIGMTQEIAYDVEKLIIKEVDDGSLVVNLKCLYALPKVNVPWNEWLVYSVINKWGKMLEANTTSNQFRLSSPVVSLIGKFTREDYEDANSGEMVQAIDLNDINAVEDYIMEDFDIKW